MHLTSRRGKPEVLVSDNGSNFVGACRDLRELIQALDNSQLRDSTAEQGIEWHFNPPTGSHHGGMFEAMVKQTKKALGAILNDKGVNDEEFLTAVL